MHTKKKWFLFIFLFSSLIPVPAFAGKGIINKKRTKVYKKKNSPAKKVLVHHSVASSLKCKSPDLFDECFNKENGTFFLKKDLPEDDFLKLVRKEKCSLEMVQNHLMNPVLSERGDWLSGGHHIKGVESYLDKRRLEFESEMNDLDIALKTMRELQRAKKLNIQNLKSNEKVLTLLKKDSGFKVLFDQLERGKNRGNLILTGRQEQRVNDYLIRNGAQLLDRWGKKLEQQKIITRELGRHQKSFITEKMSLNSLSGFLKEKDGVPLVYKIELQEFPGISFLLIPKGRHIWANLSFNTPDAAKTLLGESENSSFYLKTLFPANWNSEKILKVCNNAVKGGSLEPSLEEGSYTVNVYYQNDRVDYRLIGSGNPIDKTFEWKTFYPNTEKMLQRAK